MSYVTCIFWGLGIIPEYKISSKQQPFLYPHSCSSGTLTNLLTDDLPKPQRKKALCSMAVNEGERSKWNSMSWLIYLCSLSGMHFYSHRGRGGMPISVISPFLRQPTTCHSPLLQIVTQFPWANGCVCVLLSEWRSTHMAQDCMCEQQVKGKQERQIVSVQKIF